MAFGYLDGRPHPQRRMTAPARRENQRKLATAAKVRGTPPDIYPQPLRVAGSVPKNRFGPTVSGVSPSEPVEQQYNYGCQAIK